MFSSGSLRVVSPGDKCGVVFFCGFVVAIAIGSKTIKYCIL